MIVYIAGPMSGYPGDNLALFDEVQELLESAGHEVRNPAANGVDPSQTWADYMRLDLAHVLEAEAICLLPGWEASRGACLEVHVAHALGIPTLPLAVWAPTCRVCGCGTFTACPGGCWWVESDLCSSCEPRPIEDVHLPDEVSSDGH